MRRQAQAKRGARREDYAVGVGGLDGTKPPDADWDPHLQVARPPDARAVFFRAPIYREALVRFSILC